MQQITTQIDDFSQAEALKRNGFSEEQAKILIRTIHNFNTSHLATKSDLKDVRTELKEDITANKMAIDRIRETMATKEGLANLRNEMYKVGLWTVGVLGGLMTLFHFLR